MGSQRKRTLFEISRRQTRDCWPEREIGRFRDLAYCCAADWLYIAKSSDLAKAFFELGNTEDIMDFHDRRALYISWVYIHDEIQDGVVTYLFLGLKTTVNNPRVCSKNDVDMIPVYPPSMLPKGEEAT